MYLLIQANYTSQGEAQVSEPTNNKKTGLHFVKLKYLVSDTFEQNHF